MPSTATHHGHRHLHCKYWYIHRVASTVTHSPNFTPYTAGASAGITRDKSALRLSQTETGNSTGPTGSTGSHTSATTTSVAVRAFEEAIDACTEGTDGLLGEVLDSGCQRGMEPQIQTLIHGESGVRHQGTSSECITVKPSGGVKAKADAAASSSSPSSVSDAALYASPDPPR